MEINKLTLKNYRNYIYQEIEFCGGVNVFYGNNAQGKTNILESVFYCGFGRSHKNIKDRDIINFSADFSKIKLEYNGYNRENTIKITLLKNERKKIDINGLGTGSRARLLTAFTAILFCPEDLYLIKGGPGERRKFLDGAISQLKPKYYLTLCEYIKIINHKNKLLKMAADDGSLNVWNEKLAEAGARIILYRNLYIKRLQGFIKSIHKEIAPGEDIDIVYRPNIQTDRFDDEEYIKNLFVQKLFQCSEQEKNAKMSLFGIHKDDFEIFINGENIKLFGSQGQQRTAVLTLKMSQIELIKQSTGEYPVLLLDDILSELDKTRQEYLINKFDKYQVIITCTDIHSIKKESCRIFRVENGEVECTCI